MSCSWICSQLGTREYYLIPRALKKMDVDVSLITDHWIKPSSLYYKYYPKSRTRYHADIKDIPIYDFNDKFIFRRLFKKNTDWDKYYDLLASKKIKEIFTGKQEIFFTNCYSSLLSLGQAKSIGMSTYYQQINPGPGEAEIVKSIYHEEFGNKYKPTVPDDAYWERWKKEVQLADYIIVNSSWSKKLLVKAGVDNSRITIIPFIYEGKEKINYEKYYPESYSTKRPLQILYLGSVSLRKGFHILKKAMAQLKQYPVDLKVVGRLNGPDELLENLGDNIHYLGQVPSFDIQKYYEQSDVFILPTFSDGFALTQLEAQSYKIPIITTPFCGNVVSHEKNGIVLSEVTTKTIKESIIAIIENPGILKKYSSQSVDLKNNTIEKVGEQLLNIGKTAC